MTLQYRHCRHFQYNFFLLCLFSDPHSVLNLLVQDLLTRFSHTFLDNSLSPTLEIDSLKKFLCQEDILLLLATIYHICMEVGKVDHILYTELMG